MKSDNPNPRMIMGQMGLDHDTQSATILQSLASGIIQVLGAAGVSPKRTGLEISRSLDGGTQYKVRIVHSSKSPSEREAVIAQLASKEGVLEILASRGVT